jgi:uncharacterized protein YmfQ (DUF2313 family)
MSNRDVIAQLYPFPVDDDSFQGELNADGAIIDSFSDAVDDFSNQICPATSSTLLSNWERVYTLNGFGLSDDERRQQIFIKECETGGVSTSYLTNFAASMGYTISFSRGDSALRVGLSTIPHLVCFVTSQWVLTVVVEAVAVGSISHASFEARMNDIKRAHIRLIFSYI